MKSIKILTIYVANYGAVLQAYALKHYLDGLNDVGTVSIVNFYSLKPYYVFRKKRHPNIIVDFLLKALVLKHYIALKRRNRREKLFIKEELNLSERYLNQDDLLNSDLHCDLLLTGSDQVFNPNAFYSRVFFQSFNKKADYVKAAYAPSFGINDFSQSLMEKISSKVRDFDYISCREKEGADFLSHILNKPVLQVVDPTLLLEKSEWEKMMILPNYAKPYILVYDLNGGSNLLEISFEVKKRTGLPIVCITQSILTNYKKIDKVVRDAGPRQFVGWFSRASYILTDSFHGTVFSLIFNKPFTTYIATPKTSSRLTSLLKGLHQEDRIITKFDYTQIFNMKEPGCFDGIKNMANESKVFLKEVVSNS